MIYTCTLNPAIDLFIETDEMKANTVNRTSAYDIQANGKGVNVSFILKMLDVPNIALGIGGGFTSQYIEQVLSEKGIQPDFVHIDGITRINVFTRVMQEQKEYKLVNKGPQVDDIQVNQLISKVDQLTNHDTLSISGSFAQGIDPKILLALGQLSQANGFRLVVDTSYKAVMQLLKYKPFLLKPNDEEITSWFDLAEIPSNQELIHYAKRLVEMGAQNVLLSLGGDGAALITPTETLFGNAAKGEVVNTACSGDTMLGTFLAGVEQGLPARDNLQRSIAAASSTAFSMGLTDFKDVAEIIKQIHVNKMEDK